MNESSRFAAKAAVLAFILGAAWLYSIWPALSHSFYDPTCCSDRDCAPLPDGFVKAVKGGWKIFSNGEVIPYDDRRIKPSPDGQFHGCFPAGDARMRMICLYVPAQGV